MQKKKLFLSTSIASCIIVPTAVALSFSSNSETINNTNNISNKIVYSNHSIYTTYSSNSNSLSEVLSKFKKALDTANEDADNYRKSFNTSKGMEPTKRYNFIKNAKEKALLSKEKLTKLKKELDNNKKKIDSDKKVLSQKEIDAQQIKNREDIKSLAKDLKIINQGNLKNSTFIKEINDLEESKFQLWKLEEYTGIVLPETKKGTTIDEVTLTNGANGNINAKLKLFTKYATNPIEEINITIKGKTDAEAAKGKSWTKPETKQEKAERLTHEYNDQVDVFLKAQKNYNDSLTEALAKILERERKKLERIRIAKDVAKAELRKGIFYPLVDSLLDSAWMVNQGKQKVSDIADSINSLQNIKSKIDKIQEVFGVRFFEKKMSFNLNEITIISNKDGTIKIELKTSIDHIKKYDRTWTKVIKGKSDLELDLEKTEKTYADAEPKIQKILDDANHIKLEKPKIKEKVNNKIPADKKKPEPKQKDTSKNKVVIDKKKTKSKKKDNTKKVIVAEKKKPKVIDKKVVKDSNKKVEKPNKNNNSNLGVILGISIASIVIIGILIATVLFIKKRKKQ
ncbi:hypothetical protein [Mycoplasma todarodis]|uniref:hypothetical protein n=1 Tax=Mycoplasma todarodis TaxID=1937191 RepID=UPI003B36969E